MLVHFLQTNKISTRILHHPDYHLVANLRIMILKPHIVGQQPQLIRLWGHPPTKLLLTHRFLPFERIARNLESARNEVRAVDSRVGVSGNEVESW